MSSIDLNNSLILKKNPNNMFCLGVFKICKQEKVVSVKVSLEYLRQSLELLKSVSEQDYVDIKVGKNIPLFIGKGNAGILVAPTADFVEETWGNEE